MPLAHCYLPFPLKPQQASLPPSPSNAHCPLLPLPAMSSLVVDAAAYNHATTDHRSPFPTSLASCYPLLTMPTTTDIVDCRRLQPHSRLPLLFLTSTLFPLFPLSSLPPWLPPPSTTVTFNL
ncbi:hypothetical protein BHE74_00022893 [Ensete ventricosum]|nr:hypothetical protein BHE74_00022893 [Ensete ventricosum]RZS25333.1 hypothetical protein BHM03_00058520 [Ensete ventricosum]